MKKIFAAILAVMMLISLAACGKEAETPENETAEITGESIPNTESEITEAEPETEEAVIEGDPMEYSMDFWAEKYPDKNICPFYIEENGVEKPYYLIMEMGCSMEEWVETPFNWNGWHIVGEDIVNADETYKMTADWVGENAEQSFSSCCTVTTEEYVPQETVQ